MNAKATTRENRILGSPCFRIPRALALSDYSTNLGKSELCNYAVSDTPVPFRVKSKPPGKSAVEGKTDVPREPGHFRFLTHMRHRPIFQTQRD